MSTQTVPPQHRQEPEVAIGTERVEAFSDGVLAIIITIMVLELRVPANPTLAEMHNALWHFSTYAMSFVYIGIYWNNHHHLMRASARVTGGVMWANLHLLFWLSVVPAVTGWMGESHFASRPTAIYGVVLLLAAISFTILQRLLIAANGNDSPVALATGSDAKGKASIAIYVAAVLLALFVSRTLAGALYAVVAIIWLVPDRRIERALAEKQVQPRNTPR